MQLLREDGRSPDGALAANGNGGIVRIPAGAYDIDRRLFVKTKVDIRGAGMYATRLNLTTTAAGISFQDVGAAAGNPPLGGTSGHFLLAGALLATNPLYVGFGSGRTFERIRAENATGVTMKLESVQNSRFVALQIVKTTAAENVTIDYSSQNLGFYDCVFSGYVTDAVLIKQTGPAALVPGVARRSKIYFYGGLVEADQAPGGAAIAVTDGTDILIDSVGTSGRKMRFAVLQNHTPNLRIERDGNFRARPELCDGTIGQGSPFRPAHARRGRRRRGDR